MTLSGLVLTAIMLLIVNNAGAQTVDTIRPNPNAVTLRKVWEKFGPDAQASFGYYAGPIGDVYGTGYPAMAFYTFPLADQIGQTWVYAWDTATRQVIRQQVLRGMGGMPRMVSGNFIAGRRPLVLSYFKRETIGVYPTDSFRVDTVPIAELHHNYKPGLDMENPKDAAVADLDGDSLDDLVLLWPTRIQNNVVSPNAEIWIYRGGATFPRSDTPDVVIVDHSRKSDHYDAARLYLSDVDGDHQLDITTTAHYSSNDSNRATVYRLAPANPFDTSLIVRHVCVTTPLLYLWDAAAFQDINGDSLMDLAVYHLEQPYLVTLHTSSPGRTLDRRVLTEASADATWYTPEFSLMTGLGPLNDITGRWQMFSVNGAAFSAGLPTPDAQWDANGAIGTRSYPMKDATGDGWPDVLSVSGTGQGYAALLAGGLEIPRDPSSGVEWFAVTGETHQQSIALWPQPARDIVHIAWRGDLRRMPHHFRVHDVTGTLVAEGSVAPGQAEALWQCAHRPAGRYTLTVFDRDNVPLASTALLILSSGLFSLLLPSLAASLPPPISADAEPGRKIPEFSDAACVFFPFDTVCDVAGRQDFDAIVGGTLRYNIEHVEENHRGHLRERVYDTETTAPGQVVLRTTLRQQNGSARWLTLRGHLFDRVCGGRGSAAGLDDTLLVVELRGGGGGVQRLPITKRELLPRSYAESWQAYRPVRRRVSLSRGSVEIRVRWTGREKIAVRAVTLESDQQ